MRKRRFTDEQIISILKKSEAGVPTRDLCREHGVSPNTFYAWRKKFGGMDVPDARRLRKLEDENRKLKKLLAEQMLDNATLKEMLAKNF